MYFVDEKYVAGVEVGQKSRQVARFIEHRSGSDFQLCMHFIGDDVRQRGFTSPGGPCSSTWSSESPRIRAAWMKIRRLSTIFSPPGRSCPVRGADLIFELQVAFDVRMFSVLIVHSVSGKDNAAGGICSPLPLL